MAYLNINTNKYPVQESEIRAEYPNTSFGYPFFAPIEYVWVFPAPSNHNPDTHVAVEGDPVLTVKGHYEQTWNVTKLTKARLAEIAEEKRIASIPVSVSPAQFRLALHASGLYDQVQAAVATLEVPKQIKWEFATSVDRNNADLIALATALSLTDVQLDQLFIDALSY